MGKQAQVSTYISLSELHKVLIQYGLSLRKRTRRRERRGEQHYRTKHSLNYDLGIAEERMKGFYHTLES
ncbi:hypothetical protein BDQ12DRAFT_689068 [Crucibulum laeve]|uniref:Uncharacterized protein n=1 Tax=Crucibulum laeve TaxID=68775 RepID=A0A5C3LP97_9AGAR|nr:hypothetical protein BDQ12DRAFT_689068 [Crucibulum laeve]